MPVAGRTEVKLSAEGPQVSAQLILKLEPRVGYWERGGVIGAHHKQAVMTLVERKSGYAALAKVKNKT